MASVRTVTVTLVELLSLRMVWTAFKSTCMKGLVPVVPVLVSRVFKLLEAD